jgi:hypothetical protein
LGDEGPLGVSIALCTRAMPIRAELAAASARLGPKRAAETLLGAQKRLETAGEQTRNGYAVPSHQPPTLDNRRCGVRALWSVCKPLSERRGPPPPPSRFCLYQNLKIFLFSEVPGT